MTAPVPATTNSDTEWWRRAVVYQLYVRSFSDANSDGIGDLDGIRSHLPYLAALGIDAIWLNPCYPSPQIDHGYDVADYLDIEPAYGTLATFDALVAEARSHHIRIMMDIVPNHCSDQHKWFTDAVAAGRGSKERDWFWFRDGKGTNGDLPPNNWQAWFGGPAWSQVIEPDGSAGQWYLGLFTPQQPDVNWLNPLVGDAFEEILRFWFDRGVDGFRVDAVTVLGKAPGLPDAPPVPLGTPVEDIAMMNPHVVCRPEVNDVFTRMRGVVDAYEIEHPDRKLTFVTEAYTPTWDILASYIGPGQMHQSFHFDLMLASWHAPSVRKALRVAFEELAPRNLPLTWTLNNHDTQRSVTRYGRSNAAEKTSITHNNLRNVDATVDVDLGLRRARAMAAFMLALPGSAYLYYGEEIGLFEVLDIPEDRLQDPMWERTGHRSRGRDGCRVPMPWTDDRATNFGFSTLPTLDSWMPQPDSYGPRNAAAQAGVPGSTLAMYTQALALRRSLTDLASNDTKWVHTDVPELIAYRRGSVGVVLNMSSAPMANPHSGELLLSSSDGTCELVPANTTMWVQLS